MTIAQALARLERFDPHEELPADLDEIALELSESSDSKQALIPVLRFMERHPDADLGAPGPLVHLVERFFRRGYEAELVASLTRAPTPLTVWMLNRVINGTKGEERNHYVSIMHQLADEAESNEVRDVASEFLLQMS